jgi:hypothetical protein
MEKAVVTLAFLFLFSACAISSKDYASSKHNSETATVVGKVIVLVNASQEDLQESARGICELTIVNGRQETKYMIEKEGSLYLNAKPGVFYFKKLNCFAGRFSESSHIFYSDRPASVLLGGKINYVGDLTINWKLGETKVDWAEFLLSQTNLGVHRFGPIDMQVVSSEKTLKTFLLEFPELEKEKSVDRFIQFIDVSKF